jgi:DNA transposition AAA+ family ATPase
MSEVVRLSTSLPGNKPEHCELTAYRECHDLFDLCRRMGQIGISTGPTGCGKTTAAKAFAAKESGASYIRLTTTANTTQPFLVKLSGILRIYASPNLGKADLFDLVVTELTRSYCGKKLLIVDEMNHGTAELVHLIRDLWDAIHCGVVLIGTPDMENLWAERAGRKTGKGDAFAAFRARIGQRQELKKPNADDVDALCRHLDLKGKRERDLIEQYVQAWDGLHNFEHLLANAYELAEAGRSITAENLFDAASLTGGVR